jgi:xanthosine phosphorylase
MISTLKLLGCEILLITNSAGSLRADVPPGSLMLINDHINFQFNNPLVGVNKKNFDARFVAMEDAYDPELRKKFLSIAKQLNISLPEGVYVGVLGPSFETPAEIRAFRILGADAVGMSTVAEVIAARYYDLKVACVSGITNMGAGMSDIPLSHRQTLTGAQLTIENLSQLLLAFIKSLTDEKRNPR